MPLTDIGILHQDPAFLIVNKPTRERAPLSIIVELDDELARGAKRGCS